LKSNPFLASRCGGVGKPLDNVFSLVKIYISQSSYVAQTTAERTAILYSLQDAANPEVQLQAGTGNEKLRVTKSVLHGLTITVATGISQ